MGWTVVVKGPQGKSWHLYLFEGREEADRLAEALSLCGYQTGVVQSLSDDPKAPSFGIRAVHPAGRGRRN